MHDEFQTSISLPGTGSLATSRREFLARNAMGIGSVALAWLLKQDNLLATPANIPRQQQTFAEIRLEVGTATRSDVLRAQLEVGNAELAVIEATSALRSARLDLGRQVGIDEEVQPVEGSLPEAPPALASADSLAALAERTSPLAAAGYMNSGCIVRSFWNARP